jgi:tetratricopeptide (TPR) repeat protein
MSSTELIGKTDKQILRGLYDCRVKARELTEMLEEITDTQIQEISIKNAQSGINLPSIIIFALISVGLLCISGGTSQSANTPNISNNIHAEPKMTNESDIQKACTEMRQSNYAKACIYLRKSADSGSNIEFALSRLAECYFYLSEYDTCIKVSDELEQKIPKSSWPSYYKALVAEKQNNINKAKHYFSISIHYNNELAELQLDRLSKKFPNN